MAIILKSKKLALPPFSKFGEKRIFTLPLVSKM